MVLLGIVKHYDKWLMCPVSVLKTLDMIHIESSSGDVLHTVHSMSLIAVRRCNNTAILTATAIQNAAIQ